MKKTLLLASLSAVMSFNASAGGWCGSPICPGDIVTDFEGISIREAFESASREFHEVKKMVTLMNKAKNDILMKGNEAQADLNRTLMGITKKTDSQTEIYNEEILRDMQPDDITACNVISLIDPSTDCDAESEKSDLMTPEYYDNNVKGTPISSFYSNYVEKFPDGKPAIAPTLTNKDWIDSNDKEAAVAAVDILTNDKLFRDREKQKIDRETFAGKEQAVMDAREDIARSMARDGLLQSVVDRTGGKDGKVSKIQYLEASVSTFFGDAQVEPPDDSTPSEDLPATVRDALLTTIPAFRGADKNALMSCVSAASKKNNVSEDVMLAIMGVEGGRVGTQSLNKNGTYDYGIMQINDDTIKDLKKRSGLSYTIEQIRDDACTNIDVSAKILAMKIKEARGNVKKGIGDYNSRNEPHHSIYLNKVSKKMAYLSSGTMPQSLGESVASGEVLTSQMWRRIALLSAMELKMELESFKKWSSIEAKMASVVLNEKKDLTGKP